MDRRPCLLVWLQELNEQAEYEASDDVVAKPENHWMINDLVLFVDSEDTPRIPRQLFDEVTQIRVDGVPGPVYQGHLEALRQLVRIVLFIGFVFIIVLSFGAVYRVSSTNQTIAVVVGGFLPMILRTFLAPPPPNVELGTVSFKSKMDEVIKNFSQYWPIHDLPFELVPETEDHEASNEATTNAPAGDPNPANDGNPNNNNEVYVEDSVVDEFGVSHVLLRRLSVVATPTCPLQPSANQPFRADGRNSCRKTVTIEEEEEEGSDEVDIDILVLLPERDSERDGQWLLESQRT